MEKEEEGREDEKEKQKEEKQSSTNPYTKSLDVPWSVRRKNERKTKVTFTFLFSYCGALFLSVLTHLLVELPGKGKSFETLSLRYFLSTLIYPKRIYSLDT